MQLPMKGSGYGASARGATVYDLVAAVQDSATCDAEAVCVLAHLLATRVIRVEREELRGFESAADLSGATFRGAPPPRCEPAAVLAGAVR